MKDKSTSGTLKIVDPQGAPYATYDVWQSKWILAADTDT
jgi:hypothetical protein